MAITSGFFNSVNGDRLYNAEEMSHYFEGLITNGVYASIGDKLQVTAGDDFTVNVGTGRAMIDCHWMKNDAVYNIPIPAADIQYNRVDAIVVKLDLMAREMTLERISGELSTSMILPVIEDESTVKYLVLAYIQVERGMTTIRQGYIVDKRGSDKCPYVTGLIEQVDTSQLFAQYQDACETFYASMETYFAEKQAQFNNWFTSLTTTLGVNTELHKYQFVCKFEDWGGVDNAPLGIPEYEDGDVLLVHINGVMLTEKAYTETRESNDFAVGPLINENMGRRIAFGRMYNDGDILTAICIKSVIGGGKLVSTAAALENEYAGTEGAAAVLTMEEE